MVKIVRVKKSSKNKKKYNFGKKRGKQINFFQVIKQQYIRFLGPLFIILFIVFGITVVLQKTIFDTTNYIEQIQWSKNSVQLYDNPYLYDELQQLLSGKNIYQLSYFSNTQLFDRIKKEFPIIQDIYITKIGVNIAAVRLDFAKPDLLFKLQKRTFGVRKGGTLEIFTGNQISSGVISVDLPLYVSGVQNIKGIFYDVPQEKLLRDLYAIHDNFSQATRIVYLPGSETTVVFVYGKEVYFNHTHDINAQINKFYALESYYTGFVNLRMINLGALQEGKIIVR